MTASGTTARARRPSPRSAAKKVLQPALYSLAVTCSSPHPYPSALTTAAHSTGRVIAASFFQLLSTAARSIVSTPPASAGGMEVFSGGRRPDSTMVISGSIAIRHVAGQIVEAGDARVELEVHRAGRAMTLLADDDLRLAMDGSHFGLPLDVFVRTRARFLVAEVIFLPENE